MKKRRIYVLFISLLFSMPLHAMEIEEIDENVAQSLLVEDLPPEDQVGITDYLKDELLTPKKIAEWNTESGVYALAYHPNGNTLATGHCNGKVQIRSTEDYILTAEWDTGSKEVMGLAYDPSGRSLATGHCPWLPAGKVQIQSTNDGTVITEWNTGSGVYALGYHPNGSSLATGHCNGKMQIRNTDDYTAITKWNTESGVGALGYHPNGNSLATGHIYGGVQIRNTEGYTVITEWDTRSAVRALGYHPNGNTLATGHGNGEIQIWNILSVLAAHACQKRKLTVRQWLMLKELHDNTTNKPLYLNAGGRDTFDSLRDTEDGAERKPGIDDFYTLQKLKANDSETDETKKRWRIVPKQEEDDSQNNCCLNNCCLII